MFISQRMFAGEKPANAQKNMARFCAAKLEVSEEQHTQLEAIVRKRTNPQRAVQRAQIILLAIAGEGVRETMRHLNLARTTVQSWRRRWREAKQSNVAERLSDRPRPRVPPTSTCHIPCDYIPRKSYPLFRANEVLRLLIGEVTGDSEASEQAGA